MYSHILGTQSRKPFKEKQVIWMLILAVSRHTPHIHQRRHEKAWDGHQVMNIAGFDFEPQYKGRLYLPYHCMVLSISMLSFPRKTLEMKESKKVQRADWMRSFQKRTQAMQKTVTARAKVTDPHSNLKDTSHELLQRHR